MKYSEHDPLCEAIYKKWTSPTTCSSCQLIRKVREDMRSQCQCEKECC